MASAAESGIELRRQAIAALPSVAGDDLYDDFQGLPTPTRLMGAFDEGGGQEGAEAVLPAAAVAGRDGRSRSQNPVFLGNTAETVEGRFDNSASTLKSHFASARRWRYVSFARAALPWAAATALFTIVAVVALRPSFVYVASDEFTAPTFSIRRMLAFALLASIATFGLFVYGMATTMM